MVEIKDSTTMGIGLLSVLRNSGVCRDTTRGRGAFVVLHAMVGVNGRHYTLSGHNWAQPAGHVYRCRLKNSLSKNCASVKAETR